MPNKVIAVLSDLMFTVKITDAAKRAGVQVEIARGADEALRKAPGAGAVFLDLNFIDPELIRRLKSSEATKSVPLVGFVSHVATEVIQQARDAGCDMVLARSAFVQRLTELLLM
jgi:CheY-like chemotaxis protein